MVLRTTKEERKGKEEKAEARSRYTTCDFSPVMRPLRPSQSIRRVDGDDSCAEQVPQCRIRKVRCDGREGLCQNCDRLGFECSFQQSPSKPPGRYLKSPERRRLCAITSLHLQRAPLCHTLWAQEAERLILEKIGRPSIFHLQALLLVIRYRIETGEFPTAFMLAALAARIAVALRLNYERIELAFVAQEARRRLFWALYLLDDYFCVGLREFELCPEETIYLQLPCQEAIFEAGEHCQTGMLRPSISDNCVAMGLRGAFMRLISTRRAIMRFNRRVGLGEESSLTIGSRIQQFEQELACLQTALSPEHQYSISNLALCDWPAQFVMLHMSYYQCHCDLYRMFLTGYSEAAPSVLLANMRLQDCIAMQAACLEHAENIIRILGDFVTSHSNGHRKLLLLERDAAVCAFESARLVMFGARLACATSTLEVAINKAREVSLQFITKFFPYSASTQPLDFFSLVTIYHFHQIHYRLGASSRQRLSVQSLLLQSDFMDDSHEIAGPFPASSGTVSEAETAYSSYLQTTTSPLPNAVAIRESTGTSNPSPPILSSSSSSGVSIPRSTTIGNPLTFPPSNYSSTMNQQPSQPQPQLRPPQQPSRPASSSPWVMTIDAHREDAGLIFNPWMGFTGTEELYGLSDGLSEEY
ncbi:hypothetical protein GQX73_g843 [Xylaria multiplex]|uniref:Zn(2)-C6 fungal-type domain-containing protein n=1 Tax=Xylaria multiplex TaxID=323545 RepID=A0A7C8N465_9PEZI|nr:hypothetical protein GQX73_g843 [Xylaria multiplex]